MSQTNLNTLASRVEDASGPMCRSCSRKFPVPARYIAHAQRTDGTSSEWPICEMHMPFAMVAGWFPIDRIEDTASLRAISAMEDTK